MKVLCGQTNKRTDKQTDPNAIPSTSARVINRKIHKIYVCLLIVYLVLVLFELMFNVNNAKCLLFFFHLEMYDYAGICFGIPATYIFHGGHFESQDSCHGVFLTHNIICWVVDKVEKKKFFLDLPLFSLFPSICLSVCLYACLFGPVLR